MDQSIVPAKKSLAVRVLRFFLWAVSVFVVLIIAGVTLVVVYEKEIKAAIIGEMNRHLNAEVRVDPANIEVVWLKTFPRASLQFSDLLVLEAVAAKYRDTLLFTRRLNLHFDIKDIWNRKYGIERLSIERGVMKPRILKSGANNFTVWKRSASGASDTLRFDLKLITVEDMFVRYRDESNRLSADVAVSRLSLNGNFSADRYRLESSASMQLVSFVGDRFSVHERSMAYHASLDVNGDHYSVTEGRVKVDGIEAGINGSFIYDDALRDVNAKFESKHIELSSVIGLLPRRLQDRMTAYKAVGTAMVSGSFIYRNVGAYKLQSQVHISGGALTYRPRSMDATDIAIDGNLLLTQSASRLDLRSLSLKLADGSIAGRVLLEDLSDPVITVSCVAHVDLAALKRFCALDTVESLAGKLDMDMQIAGKPDTAMRISQLREFRLAATVKDFNVKFVGDQNPFSVSSCSLTADKSGVAVKDLRFARGVSDLRIDGALPGFFDWVSDHRQPLRISGSLASDHIAVEDFILKSGATTEGSSAPLIPGNLELGLSAAIAKLSLGKFLATDISGQLEVRKKKAMLSDMIFRTVAGSGTVNALVDNSGKDVELSLQSDVKRLNISELFREMNNFGQQTLLDSHIKGYASAHIDFSGRWSNALVSDPRSTRAHCDLRIESGELAGFSPLMSLSRFLDVDDLARIRFETLESKIDIADKAISVSRTNVRNNALNIEFSGTHSFENAIDYRFRFLVAELMAKKFKKETPFGPEIDTENRRSFFVAMTGTVDKPVLRYDRSGMKEKIREDIRQEKENVKQILREEFNVFRKDTVKPRKPAEAAFNFESKEPQKKKTLEVKKRPEEEDY